MKIIGSVYIQLKAIDMDKEIERMAAQWKHYNNHNNYSYNQQHQQKSNNHQQQPNKVIDNKTPTINNG